MVKTNTIIQVTQGHYDFAYDSITFSPSGIVSGDTAQLSIKIVRDSLIITDY